MKVKYFYIIIFFLLFYSCRNISPGHFWTKYESEHIIKNLTNQGPWGGKHSVFWKLDSTKTQEDVIRYAEQNGWIHSETIKNYSLKNTLKDDVCEITLTGFDDNEFDSLEIEFPKFFSGYVDIMKFETKTILLYPGFDNYTTTNGLILIKRNTNEMVMYNVWGE